MDGAAGADEEVVLVAQGAQGGADLDVEVGFEAGVHADDGGGRTGGRDGEHANQDQVGVVDPLEGGVGGDGEAGVAEHVDAARGGGEVRVGRPVLVGGERDEWTWRFARGGVGGYFDAIAQTVPVRAHDAVGKRLVAALLPVRARFRVGVEHARRAVREEVHWSWTWCSLVIRSHVKLRLRLESISDRPMLIETWKGSRGILTVKVSETVTGDQHLERKSLEGSAEARLLMFAVDNLHCHDPGWSS